MKFDMLALKPADTPDYMIGAWLGCISWALTKPEIVAEFRAETGQQWTPGRTGLERAIDTTTGADAAFFRAFVEWANAHVWGPIEKPATDSREPPTP